MRLCLLLSLTLLNSCGTEESENKNRRQAKSSADATQQPGNDSTGSEDCVNPNECPPEGEMPQEEMPPTTEQPDPSNPPPPTPVDTTNYQRDIAPIMAMSCAVAGCHSGSRPAKSIGLDNANGVIINFFDAIDAIEKDRMPLENYPKITATQLKTLKTWQAEGYPQ